MSFERSKKAAHILTVAAAGAFLAHAFAASASEGRGKSTAPGPNRSLLPAAANQTPSASGSNSSSGRSVVIGGLTESASFLRFSNLGTRAGTVQVSIRDSKTGSEIFAWESSSVPAHGAAQVAVKDILAKATIDHNATFTAEIRANFTGQVQHIGWSSADGALTHLTACRRLETPSRALGYMTGLGTSPLDGVVRILNTGTETGSLTLVVYDALTGAELGAWTSPNIPNAGAMAVSSAALASAVSAPAATTALTVGVKGSNSNMELSYAEGADGALMSDLTAGCSLKGGSSDAAEDHDEDEDEDEQDDEDDDSNS